MIVSPAGLGAAALFLLVQVGLFAWSVLRAGDEQNSPVEVARRSVDILRRILAPTTGSAHAERGVVLACRFGAEQGAVVLLAHVIEVPRTLPLTASLPAIERAAEGALDRGEAIVKTHGLRAERHLLRARIAGEEIIRLARDQHADLIVMGAGGRGGLREEILGSTSDIVLRQAPCEVILDTVPDRRPAGATGDPQ